MLKAKQTNKQTSRIRPLLLDALTNTGIINIFWSCPESMGTMDCMHIPGGLARRLLMNAHIHAGQSPSSGTVLFARQWHSDSQWANEQYSPVHSAHRDAMIKDGEQMFGTYDSIWAIWINEWMLRRWHIPIRLVSDIHSAESSGTWPVR